ncbi:Pentatricopeptide repeat-containing protein, chloroplastic [Sesamum alatum]|uniref:Pentatricopeptide repeat-containing protein, chloroplastic n=1 Tax=Sesamum alatum TaxID=300844 RepID=A0AAE2CB08_9LAMI|nr:Pentatricopeptide repeat-containing protein, chloroplastic [Sesamum alatum]
MEGTLFPNRPTLPIQPTKPALHPNHQRLKFNTSTLPLPPLQQQQQSSNSFPLDSLLQHLLHISSPVKSSLTSSHIVPSHNHDSLSAHFRKDDGSSIAIQRIGENSVKDEASLDFLPLKCKFLLNSILGQPISSLRSFFDSARSELLQEVDLMSLLKGLDVSGNSDKAILLFEWVVLNLDVSNSDKLDNQIIELMVKILGRESQHSVTSKLFDVIPVKEFALDVRAWTTILHAYSRSGKYDKAIALFDFMKCRGSCPTLVTYNVMLDVYGKKGRSWDKILELLDEMRSMGLEFDEFTCSTVISACGREGLVEEAKSFFDDLS